MINQGILRFTSKTLLELAQEYITIFYQDECSYIKINTQTSFDLAVQSSDNTTLLKVLNDIQELLPFDVKIISS